MNIGRIFIITAASRSHAATVHYRQIFHRRPFVLLEMTACVDIVVKTARGGLEFKLKANPTDKVSFLKYLLEAESSPEIPYETQLFWQNGKIIENDAPISTINPSQPVILVYCTPVDEME